jgi:hypothetical protein
LNELFKENLMNKKFLVMGLAAMTAHGDGFEVGVSTGVSMNSGGGVSAFSNDNFKKASDAKIKVDTRVRPSSHVSQSSNAPAAHENLLDSDFDDIRNYILNIRFIEYLQKKKEELIIT